MSNVPKERRKAAIKQMIELSYNKEDDSESLLWLRHAVKALYEEVFSEPFNPVQDKNKEGTQP